MKLTRREVLVALAAGAIAPAAQAHTMFNQWVVYRQKHLLIGSHRKDPETYDLSQELVLTLEHLLPEASARSARAPHPERLASLLGTRQLELAILSVESGTDAIGDGDFAPYGAIPLTLVTDLKSHLLVAHEDFTRHHAWLVAAALDEVGFGLGSPANQSSLVMHSGVRAFRNGVPLDDLIVK